MLVTLLNFIRWSSSSYTERDVVTLLIPMVLLLKPRKWYSVPKGHFNQLMRYCTVESVEPLWVMSLAVREPSTKAPRKTMGLHDFKITATMAGPGQ